MKKNESILSGTLLVAGTSIGGGMLALPVLTSLGGFAPSLVIYFFCWLFMASTGLLFLEISLWMPEEANIVSMAERTLGKVGKFFSWGLYLFLFY
jgi:tyrosine-specific transport protein